MFGCLCEGVRSPEAGITDIWEFPCGCWELNQGPLEEHLMLSTVEPSLQSPGFLFVFNFLLLFLFSSFFSAPLTLTPAFLVVPLATSSWLLSLILCQHDPPKHPRNLPEDKGSLGPLGPQSSDPHCCGRLKDGRPAQNQGIWEGVWAGRAGSAARIGLEVVGLELVF